MRYTEMFVKFQIANSSGLASGEIIHIIYYDVIGIIENPEKAGCTLILKGQPERRVVESAKKAIELIASS